MTTDIADSLYDQALAAFDEAARLVSTAGGVGVKKNPYTSRILSKWARGGPFEYGMVPFDLTPLPDGREGSSVDWTDCGHLGSPQVCYGLGNWPGHLMCGDCLLTNAQLDSGACDWCGADTGPIYPTVYPIGPAIVILLVCDYHLAGGPTFHLSHTERLRRMLDGDTRPATDH